MALVDNAWYVNCGDGSTTGYYAVAKWTASTAYVAGNLIRQNAAPAVGSERMFVCIIAGTSLLTEPTWTVTRGAKTAESAGPTWQECTGIAALNGDATNTPSWTISSTPPGGVKNTAVTLGQVIKRDNGASYQICTTAGTAGNGAEPGFSDTAGTTTADNTVTWTSLGVVGNFTGWQAPHALLNNAYAANWGAAGDVFYLATEHAETRATQLTLTNPGTLAAPCPVYSVTKTTVPPASANIAVGASLSTTSTGNLLLSGIYDSVTFSAGSGSSGASIYPTVSVNTYHRFDNCLFTINNTGTGAEIFLDYNTFATFVYNNCTFTLGSSTAQALRSTGGRNQVYINGGSVVFGANVPTVLFDDVPFMLFVEGLDLSGLGSGKTIIDGATNKGSAIFKNCKLGASVTKASSPSGLNARKTFINCDSSGTNYIHESYDYSGTQIVETTIVRTGGASDGTTAIAWKITTTSKSTWLIPYKSIPIAIWNDTTASNVTVTVYGIWGGGAVPTNDDIWLELDYFGTSGNPGATLVTTTKANNLASGVALTSDTSTWGGSTTKFKIAATFSAPQPQHKGPIYITVCAALASSTFYIDPKPVLS